MDGIIICRSPTSNVLLVYNPQNKQYYKMDSYRIDSYWLLRSAYQDIRYDGGFFCALLLLCDNSPPMEEKYPPRIWVEHLNPSTNMLLVSTVMGIHFPDDLLLDAALSYTNLFDNSTLTSIPFLDMADIIPRAPVDIAPSDSQDSLLPLFLCLNS